MGTALIDGSTTVTEAETAAAVTEAIEQLDSDLHDTYRELNYLRKKEANHFLNFVYDLGKTAVRGSKKILERRQMEGKTGDGLLLIRLWAAALGIHEGSLYNCVRLAETYKQRDYRQLVERGLTWTHFVILLRVADAKRRNALTTEVLREKLTTQQLAARIRTVSQQSEPTSSAQDILPDGLTEEWEVLVNWMRNIMTRGWGSGPDSLRILDMSDYDDIECVDCSEE
jgi:hypothetical protein